MFAVFVRTIIARPPTVFNSIAETILAVFVKAVIAITPAVSDSIAETILVVFVRTIIVMHSTVSDSKCLVNAVFVRNIFDNSF